MKSIWETLDKLNEEVQPAIALTQRSVEQLAQLAYKYASQIRKLSGQTQYYDAAQGDNWYDQTPQREKAYGDLHDLQREVQNVMAELNRRGVRPLANVTKDPDGYTIALTGVDDQDMLGDRYRHWVDNNGEVYSIHSAADIHDQGYSFYEEELPYIMLKVKKKYPKYTMHILPRLAYYKSWIQGPNPRAFYFLPSQLIPPVQALLPAGYSGEVFVSLDPKTTFSDKPTFYSHYEEREVYDLLRYSLEGACSLPFGECAKLYDKQTTTELDAVLQSKTYPTTASFTIPLKAIGEAADQYFRDQIAQLPQDVEVRKPMHMQLHRKKR